MKILHQDLDIAGIRVALIGLSCTYDYYSMPY